MIADTISTSGGGADHPQVTAPQTADAEFRRALAGVTNQSARLSTATRVPHQMREGSSEMKRQAEGVRRGNDHAAQADGTQSQTPISTPISLTPPPVRPSATAQTQLSTNHDANRFGASSVKRESGAMSSAAAVIKEQGESPENGTALKDRSIALPHDLTLRLDDQSALPYETQSMELSGEQFISASVALMDRAAGQAERSQAQIEVSSGNAEMIQTGQAGSLNRLGPVKLESIRIESGAEVEPLPLSLQTVGPSSSRPDRLSVLLKQYLDEPVDRASAKDEQATADTAAEDPGAASKLTTVNRADDSVSSAVRMAGSRSTSERFSLDGVEAIALQPVPDHTHQDRQENQSNSERGDAGAGFLHLASATRESLSPQLGSPASEAAQVALPQLIERIQTMARSGTRSIRLSLQPESLGQVELRLTLVGSRLSLHIAAESTQVREGLQQSAGALREALAETGLDLRHVDIRGFGNLGLNAETGTNPFGGHSASNQTLWDEVARRQAVRGDENLWSRGGATTTKPESLPARLARLLNLRI